jgi:hypothetical protein
MSETSAQPPTTASQTAPDPPESALASRPSAPRWLVILSWSTGLAALYALLSLAHAAFVERILSVDVGFGRSLAFWIGTIYLALPGWGFLPARPSAWYARPRLVLGMLGLGATGAIVCGAVTGFWLAGHWVPSVGVPVTASIAVLLVGALAVLWLAGRDERQDAPPG